MFKSLRFALAASLGAIAIPLIGASSASSAASPSAPTCIVSLSPTATETLFAIGAGPQVQAVDSDSNYPTHGLPTKHINALNPSVESVIGICRAATGASTKPNLVIISYDANSIKEKLTALGVHVVTQNAPTSLTGALAQIRQLGSLTGHVASANALASSMAKSIAADVKSVPAHPTKKLRVYYELDPTYYSLTSTTFVGALMKSLGVVNIADAKSTSADAGYPQLSAEYITSANPQLIFLADTICCKATLASVRARAGFAKVSAVVNNHVVNLSDDVASRWGPRLSLLMNQITAAVKAALADARLWK
ncbi:MAG: ABC transporter substrate-binding protein [Acidimicrobiaceae bacterium]|nr:ABC transporter substrate-binding protein [Acidimicrobiaceae bacterium]